MNHYIEEDQTVCYDDGFDQLVAKVLAVHSTTATVEFTSGNSRHPRRTREEISLSYLFPMDAEERLYEYLY